MGSLDRMNGMCHLVGLMNNSEKIVWLNDDEKECLGKAGFQSFDDFWDLEDLSTIKPELCREHSDRFSGNIVRRTVKLEIDGNVYFLKRTQGRFFQCVLNEFEASEMLHAFGLTAAEMAAYSFDHQRKAGFILLRNLDSFVSVQDIARKKADPADIQAFDDKKEELLERLINAFLAVRKAGFYYPDWRDKHIFFNFKNDSIALIDLERFVHTSQLPWYYRLGFIAGNKRKKEKQTFIKSLKSDFLAEQTIIDLFVKLEGRL